MKVAKIGNLFFWNPIRMRAIDVMKLPEKTDSFVV
jgi:hypothetical protein